MKSVVRNLGIAFSLITALTTSSALAASNEKVTLSDLHVENTDNGIQAIVGNAHNNTDSTLKHVFIKFNLYKDGAVIGNTIDAGENIAPGENYKIQAFINTFKGKPDEFKVTEVNVMN